MLPILNNVLHELFSMVLVLNLVMWSNTPYLINQCHLLVMAITKMAKIMKQCNMFSD